jgi:hypothetical protein
LPMYGTPEKNAKTHDIPRWKGAVLRKTQLTCEGQGRREWKDGAYNVTAKPGPLDPGNYNIRNTELESNVLCKRTQ